MILEFSEEQLLFRQEVERFLSKEYDFERRKKSFNHSDGCDPQVWQNLADLGILALPFPESAGGLGAGAIELGLVMEAFGRRLVVEPFIAATVVAGNILAWAGSNEQQERFLAPLIAGESRIALAHEERSVQIETHAASAGDGWVLNGAKTLVLGGPGSSALIVSARDDSGKLRLFLAPADTAGLSSKPYRLLDGGRAADIALADVRLGPDAELMGADAQATIDRAYREAILGLCWEAVGTMRIALEQTGDYVKQRRQFGRPIAAFQVVQHKLAEMAVCCEEAYAAALLAAASNGSPTDRIRVISGAKAKVGKCARLVAKEAVQLHGGMGVCEELPIASYFRKLLAFEALFGGTAAHVERYAQTIVVPGLHKGSVVLPSVRETTKDAVEIRP